MTTSKLMATEENQKPGWSINPWIIWKMIWFCGNYLNAVDAINHGNYLNDFDAMSRNNVGLCRPSFSIQQGRTTMAKCSLPVRTSARQVCVSKTFNVNSKYWESLMIELMNCFRSQPPTLVRRAGFNTNHTLAGCKGTKVGSNSLA